MQAPREAAVDLYWIPLGAGGHFVRFNGRVFEAIDAARRHRPRRALYHAALVVELEGDRYAIELAPSPDADKAGRGVAATGAVGTRHLGRWRLFRYEVRCWRGGSIPDLRYAVGGPRRLTAEPRVARRLLGLVGSVPMFVWGRDELDSGEMWNSNSVIAWLLASSGLPAAALRPPASGRAPGWHAGLEAARGSRGLSAVMLPPMDIVIAGGGVAGLEALLGLRAIAKDRVRLTLVAPDPEFSYRPLAVAEPFALGHAHRVPLTRFASAADAELVIDAVAGVDDAARQLRLRDGGTRPFHALLLAPGGHAVVGVEGATTWWPGGDPEVYGGLLRDIDEGYAKRIAIVVPPGAVWPLPAYELALMTAGEARGMGQELEVTVVTPEHTPLSLFGDEAGGAVAEELRRAGVELRTGVVARRAEGGLVLEPDGVRLEVDRVFAVPRIVGPALPGVPADDEGVVLTDDDALVLGCERTWAAGDGVASPLKFGGLATHQARTAASAIARLAGVTDAPDPGEPVIRGQLLVGQRTRRLRGRGDAEGAPLWWPQGKVAGEYLPRWLAENGITPPAAAEPPDGGVSIRRPVRDMQGAEARYLFDVGRQYRIDDAAIASLGRRMHEARDR